MYDKLQIEEGLEVDFPEAPQNPSTITWQTKAFHPCALEVYKISADGRLLKEEARYETVPEEERPLYNEEIDGFEEEAHQAFGVLNRISEGWTDTEYHGMITFKGSIDGKTYTYEAKFTDGELEDIRRIDDGGTDNES